MPQRTSGPILCRVSVGGGAAMIQAQGQLIARLLTHSLLAYYSVHLMPLDGCQHLHALNLSPAGAAASYFLLRGKSTRASSDFIYRYRFQVVVPSHHGGEITLIFWGQFFTTKHAPLNSGATQLMRCVRDTRITPSESG